MTQPKRHDNPMPPNPGPNGQPQPILTLRIPAILLSRLDATAARMELTRSQLVRMALRQGLAKIDHLAEGLDTPEPPQN